MSDNALRDIFLDRWVQSGELCSFQDWEPNADDINAIFAALESIPPRADWDELGFGWVYNQILLGGE